VRKRTAEMERKKGRDGVVMTVHASSLTPGEVDDLKQE